MYPVIIILVILTSILMCGIVLIQESKGGGLASAFSSQNSMLGVRKTTDFLEKATWTLAGIMVFLSVISAAFITKTSIEETPIITAPAAQQQTGADNVPTLPTLPTAGATEQGNE